ncbi:MAG TPA: nuclear transport factor 2 family protein [Myxococcota bacterium]|nr:nuclear transport factor 2 family protein [Myxococcota bacterium]
MPASRKSRPHRKAAVPAEPAHKKAALKTPTAARALDALARKIVRVTLDPSKFVIPELYAQDCESLEATGDVSHGHEGIQKKFEHYEQMQKGSRWKVRNVFVRKSVICIEWDADITLKDGRMVKMPEVAVHEINGGKIARERFYYNPMVLMPPRT